MYPLRGDRYKCVECKEDVGFDLCTKCHESRESNLKLGRFNQQHNQNHTFEVLRPGVARNLMFTLLSPPVLPVLPVPPVPMVASPGDEAEEPGDEEPGDEAAEEPGDESGDEAEEPESAESGDEEESEGTESGDEEESESEESRDEEESEGAESDDEEAVDSGGD